MCKKLIQSLCFVALLCGLAQHAQAANPQPIDTVTWVGNELNNMVSANIGLFVNEGQNIIGSIFAVLLVWYLMIGLFSQNIRNELLVELALNFMLCQMMLVFYDAPMPWGGGISFHQLFSKEAEWAAGTIDISTVNKVILTVKDMWQHIEVPKFPNIMGFVTYVVSLFDLVLIWLFCSSITLIAHIALGFGSLMGPLLIPFFIWPVMNWLFWGWVRFMTTYSIYIISSSAIVAIYANVMAYFFKHIVNGDYSLGNLGALILPFTMLQLIFVIAFWQCHGWARDIASGSAGMGAAVSGAVQAAAFAIL